MVISMNVSELIAQLQAAIDAEDWVQAGIIGAQLVMAGVGSLTSIGGGSAIQLDNGQTVALSQEAEEAMGTSVTTTTTEPAAGGAGQQESEWIPGVPNWATLVGGALLAKRSGLL